MVVSIALGVALAWYAAASGVGAVLFWVDKRAAERDKARVSERALHAVEAAGGWPGTLLAGWALRHKTRKLGYRLVRAGLIGAHAAVWALAVAWRAGWLG